MFAAPGPWVILSEYGEERRLFSLHVAVDIIHYLTPWSTRRGHDEGALRGLIYMKGFIRETTFS